MFFSPHRSNWMHVLWKSFLNYFCLKDRFKNLKEIVIIRRGSRPEVFCKKGVRGNFAKFTGKASFLIKLQVLVISDFRSETKSSLFESGCKLCAEMRNIYRNIYIYIFQIITGYCNWIFLISVVLPLVCCVCAFLFLFFSFLMMQSEQCLSQKKIFLCFASIHDAVYN